MDNKQLNPNKIDPSQTVTGSDHSTKTDDDSGFVFLPGHQGISISKNPFKKLSAWLQSLSLKQKLLYGGIGAIVILVIGGSVYGMLKPAPAVIEAELPEKTYTKPKPTTEPSKLTGIEIPIKTNKRPVTSIQIENSPDARPQSGLIDAGVVFEAIAEGGITRFNASFLEAKPNYIGPIRSARPYYVDMAAAFDPVFVHAGGSEAGLRRISQLGLQDLDHGANADAFRRVSDRYAPHNLYSSTDALDAVIKSRKYKQGDVKGFLRKDEEKNKAVKAGNISMQISGYLYDVSYKYDAKSNTYKRTMGGQPHTDLKSGKQLAPKVVIAMITDYSINGIYSVYRTSGTGEVTIFQDGQITKGTWTKKNATSQLVFRNAKKKVIAINKGQTWITLLGASNQVSASR